MKRNGQSVVEYILIATLVIFGVVFMGPYVLRSVAAYFKLWDEGVRDSFTENLAQAPTSHVPPMPVSCHCDLEKGSCGSLLVGSFCSANQREMYYNCRPLGCNGAAGNTYCVDDDNCCTQYYAQNCGTVRTDQTPAAGQCNYGYRVYASACADKPVECIADAACEPKCLGTWDTNTEQTCSDLKPQDDTGSTLVEYGQCQKDESGQYLPCQYECQQGYVLNATKTDCVPQTCCPAGYYYQGNCPTGSYYQGPGSAAGQGGSCAAGYFYSTVPPVDGGMCTTLPTCDFFSDHSTWSGTYYGQYFTELPNQQCSNTTISVTCKDHALRGICVGSSGARTINDTFDCVGTDNQVYCNWQGIKDFFGDLRDVLSGGDFSIDCENNQVQGIQWIGNPGQQGQAYPSAPFTGCNWSVGSSLGQNWIGAQGFGDCGDGGDMFVTCTNGALTHFSVSGQGKYGCQWGPCVAS